MLVSVVIPTFNKWDYTHRCILSLIRWTCMDNVEIIVVDNFSTDGTRQGIREFGDNVRLIENNSNLGFARATNQGVRDSTGDVVVFLNNDTEVHDNWLELLMEAFSAGSKVGAVGCKLLFPNGTIQHAGVKLSLRSLTPVSAFHVDYRQPSDYGGEEIRLVGVVTAACMAVTRACLSDVGMLDEEYVNGMEDVDLCLRIRAAGWQIGYTPRTRIIHHESISEGRFDSVWTNIMRFNLKWGPVLLQSIDPLVGEPRRPVQRPLRPRTVFLLFKSIATSPTDLAALRHTHPDDFILFGAMGMPEEVRSLVFLPMFGSNPRAEFVDLTFCQSSVEALGAVIPRLAGRDVVLVEQGFRWFPRTLEVLSNAIAKLPSRVLCVQPVFKEIGGLLSAAPLLQQCPLPAQPNFEHHFYELFLSRAHREKVAPLPALAGGVIAIRGDVLASLGREVWDQCLTWGMFSSRCSLLGFSFQVAQDALASEGPAFLVRSEESVFRIRRRTNCHFDAVSRRIGLERALLLLRSGGPPAPNISLGVVFGEMEDRTCVIRWSKGENTAAELLSDTAVSWVAVLEPGWNVDPDAVSVLLALSDSLPGECLLAANVVENPGRARGRVGLTSGRFFRGSSSANGFPCVLLTRNGLELVAEREPSLVVSSAVSLSKLFGSWGTHPMVAEELLVWPIV